MINKMITKEIKKLKDKIDELEIENTRIRQTVCIRNDEICELKRMLGQQNQELEEEINELKAELTYWKETAEYWKEKSFEFDATTKI